jgi:hypothetical protein
LQKPSRAFWWPRRRDEHRTLSAVEPEVKITEVKINGESKMGLIENQRATIEAEIKAARREQQAAEAQRCLYLWSKKNPTWSCEANFQILQNYLGAAGIQVTSDSLDLALRATRNSLAEKTPVPVVPELTAAEKREAENNRLRSLSVAELRAEVQANMRRQLATPEYGGHGSIFTPSFTAEEFKRMSPSQVRDLLKYPGSNQERPGGVRAGIDKLLRDAQLLKNQSVAN